VLAAAESPKAATCDRLLVFGAFLVWPFLADGAFTIFRRLRRGENIFKAHRSHLYQRLAIAGRTHREIACLYGLLAVVGALAGWALIRKIPGSMMFGMLGLAGLFVALWRWTTACEKRAGLVP
jgi:hypothetical protein